MGQRMITLAVLVGLTLQVQAADRATHSDDLMVNGGFEDGPKEIYGDGEELNKDFGYMPLNRDAAEVTGWLVTRGQVDLHANHVKAAEGHRSIDLNGSPGLGGIQQTIPTIKGQRYILLFKLAGHPDSAWDDMIKVLAVDVGGDVRAFAFDTAGRDPANMGWVERHVTFTASGDKTTIEFYSQSTVDLYRGPAIDDVRVYKLD